MPRPADKPIPDPLDLIIGEGLANSSGQYQRFPTGNHRPALALELHQHTVCNCLFKAVDIDDGPVHAADIDYLSLFGCLAHRSCSLLTSNYRTTFGSSWTTRG